MLASRKSALRIDFVKSDGVANAQTTHAATLAKAFIDTTAVLHTHFYFWYHGLSEAGSMSEETEVL